MSNNEPGVQEPLLAEANAAPTVVIVAADPTGTSPSGGATVQREHWSRSAARQVHTCISNLGTSVVFGALTAFGLKTIGQSVAIALVLLFIGLQVLAYYGFVNFNWRYVGGAVVRRLDINSDGRVDMKDVGIACKKLAGFALSWGVPSVLGFTFGFWLGWRIL